MEKGNDENLRLEGVERTPQNDEGWWRVAVDNASEVFKIVAPDGTLRYANAAFGRVFGYDPEEAVSAGMNVLDYVHPEDLARVGRDTEIALAELEAVRERGGDGVAEAPSNRTEYRFRHADGSWRYVEGVGTYLLDDPEVRGVVVNVRDITPRKESEERLRQSELRFRQLFEQSVDALLLHDGAGRIFDCNQEASRSLGYSREEMMRLSVADIASNQASGEERIMNGLGLWKGGAHERVDGPEVGYHLATHHRKDGTTFPVEVRVGEVDCGGERMLLASCRDISALKTATEALYESEERFRGAFENTSIGMALIGLDGRYLKTNPALRTLLGYREEELPGMSFWEVTHPEDRPESRERERRLLDAEQPDAGTIEKRYLKKDGGVVWALSSVSLVRDVHGNPSHYVSQFQNITRRKEAEASLQESELRFRQLFEQSAEALFVHDGEGNLVDCNAEACRSVGYSREELIRLRVSDLTDNLIARHEQSNQDKEGGTLWQRILAGDQEIHQAVHFGEHFRKDGTTFPIEVRLSGVDYDGRRLILASARDITERRELEEQLKLQALHDPLTELPNRTLFMDRLELALERAKRDPRERAALLFMDLDDFKGINDRFGHDAGDALLLAAAARLSECVRPGDTVSRFGGDEFAVLLEAAGPEVARELTAGMESVLAEPFDLGQGRRARVSASIGLALAEPERQPNEILQEADREMYRRKSGA